jgi:hypothetical protein
LRRIQRVGTALAIRVARRCERKIHQEASMGKRGGSRVKATVKDLSSGRTAKVKGGGVAAQGSVAQKVRVTDIKDGTSNTMMFGEVVPRP